MKASRKSACTPIKCGENPKTNGRANNGDLWETNWTRQSGDDGAERPYLFYDPTLHNMLPKG
jgi:hypothetical protein